MQRFERWQPVEVRWDAFTWRDGSYVDCQDGRHRVLVLTSEQKTVVMDVWEDDNVRPLPRFEATGDELQLLEMALNTHLFHLLDLDIKSGGRLTDAERKAKYTQLRDRVRAALEAGR